MLTVNQLNKECYRFSWLDLLKGIGIILVVIGHVYSNATIINWLYSFHMPLFFFAAGYVYKKKPILTSLKRRIETIVIPYFSFGFLVLIYWVVIERRFRESSLSVPDSFVGLLRGQYDYLDFNVHLWFLPCFFMTVIIYNILMNINKMTAYITIVLMSILYIIAPLPQLPWGLDRVLKYIVFYAIGNMTAEFHLDKYLTAKGPRENNTPSKAKMLGGIIATVLFVINFFLVHFNFTTGIMWFVTGLIGTFGTAIVALLINHNRWLQYLGKISLVVLCIHGPIYRVVIKIMSIPLHIETDAVRENFVFSIIVVTVTLAISAVVYEMVLRIAPWMIGKK